MIVLASNSCWNLWNFRRHMIKQLIIDGHEVVIFANEDQYKHLLEHIGCRFYKIEFSATNTSIFRNIILINEIIHFCLSERPRLVLSYTAKCNIYYGILRILFRYQHIATVTGLGYFYHKNSLKRFILLTLYKLSLLKSNHVFIQNKDDLRIFSSGLLNTKKFVHVSGSGVDCEYFAPKQVSPRQTSFLMIARLLNAKGIEEFYEAAKIIKQGHDVEFTLLGDYDINNPDAISKDLYDKLRSSNIVKLINNVDDVRPLIARASAVVLSSHREGLSRSLLEAGAMAKPLIASDVAGCNELIVENKNGFLFEPGSVGTLVSAIERFIALDETSKNKFGQSSRQLVLERYNVLDVVNLYKRKIGELIV